MYKAFQHIVFLLSLSVALHGQYSFHNYKKISTDEGLPSRYVYDITEDQYGFIWIATAKGLIRYDGSSFNTFESASSDSVFLQSNLISALLADGDSLWVGTQKGLSILNLKTGKVLEQNIGANDWSREAEFVYDDALRIWNLYKDHQDNIWVAPNAGGFVKWNKQTKTFQQFPLSYDPAIPNSYPKVEQMSIMDIRQDVIKDSIIWGASMAGLIKLNQETGQISRILYTKQDEGVQYKVNRKICIHQEPDGKIYSGSWSGGLSIYNPATGDYLHTPTEFPGPFPAEIKPDHLYAIIPGPAGYRGHGRVLLHTNSQGR